MSKLEITIMVHNISDNTVLVQNRIKNWCGITFPGGHVENGETLYDSAVREIKEETGLVVKNLKYCGIMHWFNKDNGDRYLEYFYKTEYYEGTLLQKTDEGEVFFVPLDGLKNMQLSPNFAEYLPLFLEERYSEIYCGWREGEKFEFIYR